MSSPKSTKFWLSIYQVAPVILLASVMLFAGLGSFPLTDRDEGEYASSTAYMIESGDFIVPHLNGRPYLEKPILFFWTLAASFELLGQNEFAARFPSALAAFVLLGSMFWVAGSWSGDRRISNVSVIVLLASPLFLLVARACLTDMMLTLFVWLSMTLFYFYLKSGRVEALFFCWFFLSLAFLTKGPVALAMSIPVFLAYSASRRDFSWLLPGNLIISIIVFLSVSLPWYVLIYKRMGSSFIETFFLTQNIERFTSTLLGHGGGPIFYIIVLAMGCFPFSAILPTLLAKGIPVVIHSFRTGRVKEKNSFFIFCLMASVWIFLFLTVSATKQINYIVPAIPFLSVCIATSTLRHGNRFRLTRASKFLVIFLSSIFFLVPAIFFLYPDFIWKMVLSLVRFDSTEYAFTQTVPQEIRWLALALPVLMIVIFWGFLKAKAKVSTILLVSLLFSSFLVLGLLPRVACVFQDPAKQLAQDVKNVLQHTLSPPSSRSVNLVSFGLWKPSMIFYTSRPIFRIKTKNPERLAKVLSKVDPCFVFSRLRLTGYLERMPGFIVIKGRGGYLLGGNKAGVLVLKGNLPQDGL